jgi:hypothetical protein
MTLAVSLGDPLTGLRARSPTDAGVPSRSGQALARDEQQPCRLQLARGLLLAESSRLVVAVAIVGTLHGRPDVACGRLDGPDRCRPRSLAGSEAPSESTSPKGAHNSSPRTENRSVRFAGLLEPTLGLEPRTSFEPLSLSSRVIVSHLRSGGFRARSDLR